MTPEQLAAIKARADKATAGPWRRLPRKGSRNQQIESDHMTVETDDGRRVSSVFITAWKIGRRNAVPTADFIAHARTDVPALVAEVERLQRIEAAARAVEDADLIGYETPEQRMLHEELKAALRAAGSGD